MNDIELEGVPLGISIEGFNQDDVRVLTLGVEPSRILPYINQIQNSITYEVSRTRTLIVRKDYSLFDWFGDIGGFLGLFFELIGPVVISWLLIDGASFSIANQVIDITERSDDDDGTDERQAFLSEKFCPLLRLKLTSVFRKCFCGYACKQTKLERCIEEG